MKTYVANSLDDMTLIAKKILKQLSFKKPLLLNGKLGSGKTTLVKYIAKELNISDIVNSPSFTIMKIYKGLIHIDAYRIKGNLDEYYDYFDDNKHIIIEWSNNVNLEFDQYLKIDVYIENNKHIFKIIEDI